MQQVSADLQQRLSVAEGHGQAWASISPDEVKAALEHREAGCRLASSVDTGAANG